MVPMQREARKFLDAFSKHSSPLVTKGKNVEVLEGPNDFYAALQNGLAKAMEKVVIAILYCGTGKLREADFLTALRNCHDKNLQKMVLLDALRGSRPTKDALGVETSSAIELSKMLDEKTKVALFHTPTLRGMLKRLLPPRVNEIVGVSHIKAYSFDDDLLMSGANLSNDYFTIRQDRYLMFRNSRKLVDWVTLLVQAVSQHSYQLRRGGTMDACPVGLDPIRRTPRHFSKSLRAALLGLSLPSTNRLSDLPTECASSIHCNQDSPQNSIGSEHGEMEDVAVSVAYMAEQALGGQPVPPRRHAGEQPHTENNFQQSGSDEDTWIFPSVQLGCVGIDQDEAMTLALIEAAEPGGTLILSSPYLNLARRYQTALARASKVDIELLTASPSASGFFGAAGPAGFIPKAYSMLQRSTWKALKRAWSRLNHSSDVSRKLMEYKREGWQYHAKGIWYIPPGGTTPIVTTIGSPNFGYRSVHRDLECQFFLVTTNRQLQQDLKSEIDRLREHAVDVSDAQLKPLAGPSYRARLAARLMRSFL